MLRHFKFLKLESISVVVETVCSGCVSFFLPGFCCAFNWRIKMKHNRKEDIFFIHIIDWKI
jgi:hypothetical protein